ncbi:MAG: heme ABC exporter ATP-binding protein CcmA [Alphaproteobacteria bacterium]
MRFFGQDLACVRGERLVFSGLDFALTPGEALILAGRNGSGKTTLLRLMAGLAPYQAGGLGWDDGPVRDDPERHAARLHYVAHLDAVKPALTVWENLEFWARLRGGDSDGARAALARLGLDGLSGVPARYLSAGQRHRLSLARLLAAPAVLWLLDEPTVALDGESVTALMAALAEHRAGGGMAVIATNVDLGDLGASTLDMRRFAPDPGQAGVSV